MYPFRVPGVQFFVRTFMDTSPYVGRSTSSLQLFFFGLALPCECLLFFEVHKGASEVEVLGLNHVRMPTLMDTSSRGWSTCTVTNITGYGYIISTRDGPPAEGRISVAASGL
jgi:hypothetical protein